MSLHKKISFFKSGIRILGYVIGAIASVHSHDMFMHWAFVILVASEVIGIIEELGEK